MYTHFNDEYFKKFSDKYCAPFKLFEFGSIKVDQKPKDELPEVNEGFFSNLGIQ